MERPIGSKPAERGDAPTRIPITVTGSAVCRRQAEAPLLTVKADGFFFPTARPIDAGTDRQ